MLCVRCTFYYKSNPSCVNLFRLPVEDEVPQSGADHVRRSPILCLKSRFPGCQEKVRRGRTVQPQIARRQAEKAGIPI